MRGLLFTLLVLPPLALSACKGGSTPQDDTQTPTETGETGTEELPPWAEMNEEQKNVYMTTVVTPEMAVLFQAFNADRFAEFDCATCHGSSAASGDYAMPGDIDPIPQPPPAPTASAIAGFMHNEATPKMAELLDMELASPDVQGFGCFGCHEVKAPQ